MVAMFCTVDNSTANMVGLVGELSFVPPFITVASRTDENSKKERV